MREEVEKKEEGYREWLQAATSVRDFFFFKRLSREMDAFSSLSLMGRWRRRRTSLHRRVDEETTGSITRQRL